MRKERRARWPAVSRFAVSLGSNLGDRMARLRFGRRRIAAVATDLRCSRVYETAPAHVTDQPEFLNACCVGETRLTPRQLLSHFQDAERAAGRDRSGARFGPRTLDLDLLLYGTECVETDDLVVPHPRLRERAFVLVPLAEVAGDWMVPATDAGPEETVAELAKRVDSEGVALWSEAETWNR
jgi:2-amino-4-hydroxy-6-hydroxymethyldihydropteridine diphosphokinase